MQQQITDIHSTPHRRTEPLALPASEPDVIRDLELENADLRNLVCDLLALASLPDYIVARAERLIGVYRSCAWCLHEQGIAAGEGSHGICSRHRDLQWDRHLQRKAAKRECNERARS